MPESAGEGDMPPFRGVGVNPPLVAEPLHEAFDGVDLLGPERPNGVVDRVVHMFEYTNEPAQVPMWFCPGLRGEVRGLF